MGKMMDLQGPNDRRLLPGAVATNNIKWSPLYFPGHVSYSIQCKDLEIDTIISHYQYYQGYQYQVSDYNKCLYLIENAGTALDNNTCTCRGIVMKKQSFHDMWSERVIRGYSVSNVIVVDEKWTSFYQYLRYSRIRGTIVFSTPSTIIWA